MKSFESRIGVSTNRKKKMKEKREERKKEGKRINMLGDGCVN